MKNILLTLHRPNIVLYILSMYFIHIHISAHRNSTPNPIFIAGFTWFYVGLIHVLSPLHMYYFLLAQSQFFARTKDIRAIVIPFCFSKGDSYPFESNWVISETVLINNGLNWNGWTCCTETAHIRWATFSLFNVLWAPSRPQIISVGKFNFPFVQFQLEIGMQLILFNDFDVSSPQSICCKFVVMHRNPFKRTMQLNSHHWLLPLRICWSQSWSQFSIFLSISLSAAHKHQCQSLQILIKTEWLKSFIQSHPPSSGL